MILYAVTIFLGAFLLFLVQPLIGKYILPWFGGSPGVWTTCLLFFQVFLLGGYAYAHAVALWLRPRRQALLHAALLGLALLWLPIVPDAGWKPSPGDAPVLRILLLLGATLGLPYLVLSATGPLVQSWFSLRHPGVSPYRLYALSNFGSLLALAAYPFALEPLLPRVTQAWVWSAGFLAYAGCCGALAWRVRHATAAPSPAPAPVAPGDTAEQSPGASATFFWVLLPALASLLLVASTNKLSTDVAVTPFLWVVPLGLYLISFILCFDHPRWYRRTLFSALFAAGCAAIWLLLDKGLAIRLPLQVAGYTVTFFAACMICHGELHLLKPAPAHLTRFYLCIAGGGALGGLAVAVAAPRVFSADHDLPIGLWAVAYLVGVLSLVRRSRKLALGAAGGALAIPLLLPALMTRRSADWADWWVAFFDNLRQFNLDRWLYIVAALALMWFALHDGVRPVGLVWRRRMSAFPLLMSVLLGIVFVLQANRDRRTTVEIARNFYGTLKVREYTYPAGHGHYRVLTHGVTTHGLQVVEGPERFKPASYYGFASGIGRAIDAREQPARHIGMVGLGAGSIAAYGLPGDRIRIYEINPEVIRLARERFTYLADSVAQIDIVPGDARLTMEDELRRGQRQQFDVLALDAFSSDSIPVHLLTREAFGIYLQHLKPDGILAVHISNRHLDLRPVVHALALDHRLSETTILDEPEDHEWWLYGTTWVLLARDAAALAVPAIRDAAEPPAKAPAAVLWTDDFASIFRVLK